MQFCRISAPFFHFEKLPFQPSSNAFIFFFFLLFSLAAVAAEHTHRRNPNSLKAMPEARDRRPTPLDVAAIYARRRASLLGVLHDDLDPVLFGSTPRPSDTPREVTGSGSIRRAFGTPGNVFGRGRARSLHGSPALGVENTPLGTARRGRGRASSRSVLPSWYPRTPLRDITAIVRAIERRRARLGENEGQQAGNSFPADQLLPDPSVSGDGAHLEHGASVISPNKQVGFKFRTPAGSKVPKILLDIANPSEGESELTPQKKLLNSIDTVEKVVREELQKLKRTPSAKKAEREKRVRTLMSMR